MQIENTLLATQSNPNSHQTWSKASIVKPQIFSLLIFQGEEQLELEIEVLKDLLYISMLQNVEMKYEKMEAELTLSQEIESLKR